MLQYTKSEFYAGPKDGDKRVADRTKVLAFSAADPEQVHVYTWSQTRNGFAYDGTHPRGMFSRVEPLSVGVER